MEERYARGLAELREIDREMAITLESRRLLCGDTDLRLRLESARDDHERHVLELDRFMRRHGERPLDADEHAIPRSMQGELQRARKSAPDETVARLASVEHLAEDRYLQLLEGGDVPPDAEHLVREHHDDELRHAQGLDEASARRCEL